jgi:hypothetical protein
MDDCGKRPAHAALAQIARFLLSRKNSLKTTS